MDEGVTRDGLPCRLRVLLLLTYPEATHASCYRRLLPPTTRPATPATRPGAPTPLRRPPRPHPGRAGAARGGGLLPRPPLLSRRHPLAVPVPDPCPPALLPRRRGALPGLAPRPTLAALFRRYQRLLQSTTTPARGRPGPSDAPHGPARPGTD